jgi:hypothetical protein
MSIILAARYSISAVEDLGSSTWRLTGTVNDESLSSFLAPDAQVGNAIFDENPDTGVVNRWKIINIVSASLRNLICDVQWDDIGDVEDNIPQVWCDAALCGVSTTIRLAEVPVLVYTYINESIQVRINNINNRVFIDSHLSNQYSHQYSASTSWVVSHGLGCDLIMVQCFSDDSPKKMIMPSEITLDSQIQCTINWNGESVAGSVCVLRF